MMFLQRASVGALGAATLALLLVSSPVNAQVATSTATSTPAISTTTDVATAVANYFADVPTMAAIAKCESNATQYDAGGDVLSGGSGGMLGVFQINGSVHKAFALSLGDDIDTLQGNMAYARYLYNNEGTEPWDSSKFCWGTQKVSNQTTAATATGVSANVNSNVDVNLNSNLKLGSVSQQVVVLQKLLNSAGYYIAKSGRGSPGHESTSFGALTLAAVERFQCAQDIACKGTPSTTGYGYVGAKTRAALMVNS